MPGYTRGEAPEYIPLPNHTRTSTAPNETQKPKIKRRSPWTRIGILGTWILLPLSLVTLIPVALLAVLWTQSANALAGGKPQTPWIDALNRGWLTGVVTICTAVIRIIVGLQVSQTTAMLAAVILEAEAVGTPLMHLPFFSMVRALSTTPNYLLYPFRLQPGKSILSFCICLLVILEALLLVASQFLSTLLVSDFGSGIFILPSETTSIPLIPHDSPILPWWSVPPSAAWTFGELSDPFSQGPGYHDTGHTYRAIPLFETESSRVSLREYTGFAPVMDNRVVCVAPRVWDVYIDRMSSSTNTRIWGKTEIGNESYPQIFRERNDTFLLEFDCPVPLGGDQGDNGGESTLCAPYSPVGNPSDPLIGSDMTEIFLILDVISREALTAGAPLEQAVNVTGTDGPWMVLNGDGKDDGADAVRVTACVVDTEADTFLVEMHRSWDGIEPRMGWDRESGGYSTSDIRRQLGLSLSPASLQDRGLLSLSAREQWMQYTEPESPYNGTHEWSFLGTLPTADTHLIGENRTSQNPAIKLSLVAERDALDNAHLTHVHLFQDTLRETGSPALAAQALVTRSFQMAYYEQLPRLELNLDVEAAFAVARTTPVRWTGFGVVMGIVAGHLGVTGVIIGLFLSYTRTSLVGETWFGVSEVVAGGGVPGHVLERTHGMKDAEIEKWGNEGDARLSEHVVLRYRH
ncbi:hypothetical protein BJX66DRAFT_84830 [Aspergillus keveii]|uniref:Uncharacterized protein n=1 Tax=Aspergillus keveii TaxID=714993 RepID=A0ABR4FMN0_9EURO